MSDFSNQLNAAIAKQAREVSTIAFPYFDLDEALKVAKAIYAKGGVPLERDQVAAALNSAGGTLANKLSAAKQFGLVDSQQGKWSLTPLGFEIIEPEREPAAKAEAFLNVELYRRAYEEYRGRILPSKAGLEHAFTTFGVAAKQKEKARQTFERSARSAGFFPNGKEDRLVAPVVGAPLTPTVEPEPEVAAEATQETPVRAQASAAGPAAPAFMGWLLDELPEPKSEWSTEEQANWLQAVAQAFRVVYRAKDGGRIKVEAVGTAKAE